ncbi:hypothetical protein BMJ28_33540 [Sinorhizobium medicae]|nr:hypothetical protein BMJ28_33540 [Sinorhizobium medicae]
MPIVPYARFEFYAVIGMNPAEIKGPRLVAVSFEIGAARETKHGIGRHRCSRGGGLDLQRLRHPHKPGIAPGDHLQGFPRVRVVPFHALSPIRCPAPFLPIPFEL